MANFWCVDREMSESSVTMKIPISGVLWYGNSHCDNSKVIVVFNLLNNSYFEFRQVSKIRFCSSNIYQYHQFLLFNSNESY